MSQSLKLCRAKQMYRCDQFSLIQSLPIYVCHKKKNKINKEASKSLSTIHVILYGQSLIEMKVHQCLSSWKCTERRVMGREDGNYLNQFKKKKIFTGITFKKVSRVKGFGTPRDTR